MPVVVRSLLLVAHSLAWGGTGHNNLLHHAHQEIGQRAFAFHAQVNAIAL
jgi:hypothetical protein